MRLTFLIVIMATTCLFSIGQNIYVVDSLSLEKLPYASISYQKIKGQNCVRISNIGYQTKTVQQSKMGDTVFLAPISYLIDEVVVNSKRSPKYYHLGYHREKRLFYNTASISALPYRVLKATKISAENSSDLIEGVYLPLRRVKEESKFKLYLMSVGLDGLPKDTLLKKRLDAKEYNRKVYVDVSEHYLNIPPNGIFIVFEWGKKNYDYGRELSIVTTEKYKSNNSYSFYKDHWRLYDLWGLTINFAFGFKMRKE